MNAGTESREAREALAAERASAQERPRSPTRTNSGVPSAF